MITAAQPEVLRQLRPLLEEAEIEAVVISDGQQELGAIVSMRDYQIIRCAKADRVRAAMAALGQSLRDGAASEGISPEELERMLDRKAS